MTHPGNHDLAFPPLMWGEETRDDAFDHALMRATLGCEAGLVSYRLAPDVLQGALVLAPEVPLSHAMAMLPLCGIGLQNALGVLAPPEVAVHLEWSGAIRINGARCGAFRAVAATGDAAAIPDWLVVGFSLPLLPATDRPGDTPDETALFAEGCADVSPPALIEAWARHSLNWIARWEQSGSRALHEEWRGLAHGIGEDITISRETGTFVGIDEDFSLLLRQGEATRPIPLTSLLEPAP